MHGLNKPQERTALEHVERAIRCFDLNKNPTKSKDLLLGGLVGKYIGTSDWVGVEPILKEFLKFK